MPELHFLICPSQWLLVPTMILDTDADGDGGGLSSISICFLCLSLGITF